MKIYPSDNGLGLILVSIIILLFYFFTGDIFLAYASFFIFSFLLIVFLLSYNNWKEKSLCKTKINERIWIWENVPLNIIIEGKNIYAIENIPKWIKINKIEFTKNSAIIKGETNFPHYGEFSIKKITVLRKSFFRLFIFKEEVSIEVKYKVLPETLYWIFEALNILREVGIGHFETGAQKSSLIKGLYYETREYVYGDPIRNIDWKATARHRKLMVKLFEEEKSKSMMLLYNLKAPSPYVCDDLASAFLSSILSSIRKNLSLTLVDLLESKSYFHINAYQALALAIKKVLELEIVKPNEFYEYIEPLTKEEFENLIQAFMLNIIESKNKIISLGDNNILISTLLYDISDIINLAEIAMKNKKDLNIVTASKPWIGIKDLEEAYRIYLTYKNVKQKLEKMKVNVFPWSYFRAKKNMYELIAI
jgi:hypothetical protein